MPQVREDPATEELLSDAEASQAARRYLFRRFWSSGLKFWSTRRAWVLTLGLALVISISIGVQYGLNVWNRKFFDALENRDTATAITQGIIFPILAAISVLLGVIAVNLRMATQRSWRAWLTNDVTDYWLSKGRYFQLNLIHGDHGNPEYRIAEDLRIGTDAPVDFAAGLLQALLSALTFIVVLWTIGGSLTIPFNGGDITIPGFLVIGAIIYAVIASGSMVVIGRRFVSVAEAKNQSEAEYRYVLTRLRENGESIALLGGEDEERAGLNKALKKVLRAWRDLAVQHMRTTVVSQGSGQLAPVIPVLLCAPKFLAGNMSLGEVMQAASAFVIVQTAFSWLVDNYPRFADWTASARRAGSLLVSLDSLERAEEAGVGYIQRSETKDAALRLRNVSVTLDDGTQVIKETDVSVEPGEKVLVVGESGTGKSSLVRALAGLWPWGGGEIQFRKGAKLFLLPQRPYLPVGTLRRAVSYPSPADAFGADKVKKVMEQVGLKDFVGRLDEEEPWDQILSGGEKQRLAFARLILQEPDIVVLDEATSALDPSSQDELMELLRKYLEKSTVLSVGHRPELEAFHERKLVMESQKDGARLARDINIMSQSRRRRSRWKWRVRRKKQRQRAEAA
jgi:vitamin B12/bleomycin/antimicrobial peptide transport system ATP-binding/permease protein